MSSNILSRAGLIALLFALIISFVSAVPVPIPASQSGLSSSLLAPSTRDGKDLIQRDIGEIAHSRGNVAIWTVSATTGVLTVNNTPVDMDSQQLVRRRRNPFKKLFNGIKKAAKKVGQGIKKAAKFTQHNIGKIAKFGLKVVSMAGKVAAKISKYIPVVGDTLSQAFNGAAKVTGMASDKIHANLGSKLETGMNVMNKADTIMGFIPREFSEEEGFQERDISAAYDYLEERDDFLLEDREPSYFDAAGEDIYERTFDYDLDWE